MEIQSNSVITNCTEPWKYVRFYLEIVITVNVYVVNPLIGAKKQSIIRSL